MRNISGSWWFAQTKERSYCRPCLAHVFTVLCYVMLMMGVFVWWAWDSLLGRLERLDKDDEMDGGEDEGECSSQTAHLEMALGGAKASE